VLFWVTIVEEVVALTVVDVVAEEVDEEVKTVVAVVVGTVIFVRDVVLVVGAIVEVLLRLELVLGVVVVNDVVGVVVTVADMLVNGRIRTPAPRLMARTKATMPPTSICRLYSKTNRSARYKERAHSARYSSSDPNDMRHALKTMPI
jgi:hypothetical protein